MPGEPSRPIRDDDLLFLSRMGRCFETPTTTTGVPANSIPWLAPRRSAAHAACPAPQLPGPWSRPAGALEISNEMGNSPEVVQRDYSHLFREFVRGERLNPE